MRKFPTNIVKLHLFLPSKRKLWTVVGNSAEYWVDLDLDYCTCKYYYFKTLSGKDRCIHLRKLSNAIKENKFDKIIFDDSEYQVFLVSLMKDILKKY
ncbi:MAG: hypothetical protein ACPKPY_11335 [Nitrososphaeraceae archaeon]